MSTKPVFEDNEYTLDNNRLQTESISDDNERKGKRRQRQENIVFGYIHENMQYMKDIEIPIDIVTVCISFYDKYFYWEFDQNKLKQLREIKCGSCLKGKRFYCNNISFELSIYPNEKWDIDSDFDTGYIYLKPFIPYNVSSITAFLHFYCEQNEAEFKITKIFKDINHENEANHIQGISDRVKWIFKLPYKDWNNLFIVSCMDILQIKYKKEMISNDYNKDIKISKISKLEWRINEELLIKMRSAIHLQCFISEMFDEINENYCIYIVPQGCSDIDKTERTLEVIMVLFRMPYKIKCIEYKYIITNDYDDSNVNGILRFNGYSEYKYWWFNEQNKFLSSNLEKINHLTFYVTIEIQNIYDHSNQTVPISQWVDYGIIT